MIKFEGKYRGIVIQNNDPNQSGRVKVFVPGINLHQTKNWNQQNEEDKIFKVLGQNTNSSLTPEIINNQKEKLFWAEVMMPVFGMSAPGYYRASTDFYYIGNDSDYLFQNNKTTDAFQLDSIQASLRINIGIQNPNYGISPRSSINFNFPQIGAKYCIPRKCDTDNNGDVNNFWKKTNTQLDNIISQLPKVYKNKTTVLDKETYPLPSTQKNKNSDDINYSVLAIDLDVTDPTVYLNDVPIPKDSPVYNTNCFYTPSLPSSTLGYEAPILYVSSTGIPANSYSELPVGLTINGKKSLKNNFQLQSSNDNEVIYKDGNLKVVVDKTRINSITIFHNNNRFDYNKINALKPLLSKKSKIIMPRAPRPNGQKMISRGGGGAEIFANVISQLLPLYMRMDAHIGGANNESRYNINTGRSPLNDPNNVKGCNIIGNIGQSYRGPMRAADYNNNWKGILSIPGVGSHVWVVFNNGDSNYPVIIGTFASQNDFKTVYNVKTSEESSGPEVTTPPLNSTTTAEPGDILTSTDEPVTSPLVASPEVISETPNPPIPEMDDSYSLDNIEENPYEEELPLEMRTSPKPFIPYETEGNMLTP
jgi:hypothetical protein